LIGYDLVMANPNPPGKTSEAAGTGTAEPGRARRGREMIAEGIAQLDAGLGTSGTELDAWLDAWERGDPLPPPTPKG